MIVVTVSPYVWSARTVISALAETPFDAVTVTVAVPVPCAVTRPVLSTVTTDSASLVHRSVLSVALSGRTVAVSC